MSGRSKFQTESRLLIFKRKAFEYLRTSRLSAWLIATVFFFLGTWYSYGDIPFYESILVIFSLGGIMSSTSWINFVFDKELDTFAGDDTSFFENISSKEMILSSLFISIVSLILLFYLNYLIFLTGLLIVVVGILYSTPPVRLKVHPPLDSIANALEFGTLPALLGIFIFEFDRSNVTLYGLVFISGIIVISYYLFLAVLDIETDSKFGTKTTATLLGFNRSIYVGVIIFFCSLSLALIFFDFLSVISISLLVSSPLVLILIIRKDDNSIRKVLSILSIVWTETVLLLLFFWTNSVLPLFVSVIVMLSASYFIYVYFTLKKR
jgi:4-hydroxybenzoate polyprenyltransferase